VPGLRPQNIAIVAGRATPTALRQAARHYDLVLHDLGAGLDRAIWRVSAWADILMVPLTEEPPSLTDGYAVLKLHRADRPERDARVVVNRAATRLAGGRTFATSQRACAAFLGRAPGLAGAIRRLLCCCPAIPPAPQPRTRNKPPTRCSPRNTLSPIATRKTMRFCFVSALCPPT
jgi:hypothetical protein